MAITSEEVVAEFDRAVQDRTNLSGRAILNPHFPNERFRPGDVASTCRFMCYPQSSMRRWYEGGIHGPTVVLYFEVPSNFNYNLLNIVFQIIPVSDGIDTNYTRPWDGPYLPGGVLQIVPPQNSDSVTKGKRRLMFVSPGFFTSKFDPVQKLNLKPGLDHFLRISFNYGRTSAFWLHGGKFKIEDGDTGGQVKMLGDGMISHQSDLWLYNFANSHIFKTEVEKRRELQATLGPDEYEDFHDNFVPANTVIDGLEPKDVDIIRPVHIEAYEPEDPRWESVTQHVIKWVQAEDSTQAEGRRNVDSPATAPSSRLSSDGNSPGVSDSISNRPPNEEEDLEPAFEGRNYGSDS